VPVELVDLELSDPGEFPDISIRNDRVRVIVRLDGTPIGVFTQPYVGADLDRADLVASALAHCEDRLWAKFAGDQIGLGEPSDGACPAITVVVCTRNRPGQLDDCLEALSSQRYPRYEVLVVDNASAGAETRRVVERRAARYVHEPRPGLDWARNRGLAESHTEIVAYTDDDARPEPGWLEAIARGFCSPDVLAVTGLVLPAELATRAQILFEDVYGGMGKGFDIRVSTRRGRTIGYQPERLGVGCNMAFRREALTELGGFDPGLDVGTVTGGGGDLDAFQRLLEADGAIAYRPDAVVRHVHRRSMGALRRQVFDNGRAYSAFLCAALLRARGTDRLRVVARYWRWILTWHLGRIAKRLLRRERLSLWLLLAELSGAPLGPIVYARARRTARALGRSTAQDVA
jgi:glycosyltransferase involved in cell wall biosynthesis